MIALYIIGGVLLLLLLLLRLPVRVSLSCGTGERTQLQWQIGPVHRRVRLRKKDGERASAEQTSPPQRKSGQKWIPASWDMAFAPIWEGLQRGLQRTRRQVRIDPLELEVIFGGDDPADVAMCYGWANNVLWRVMPRLEELVRMPHPRVRLVPDFDAAGCSVQGKLGIRCPVGGLLAILFAAYRPILRWKRSQSKKTSEKPSPSQQENTRTVTEGKDRIYGNERKK